MQYNDLPVLRKEMKMGIKDWDKVISELMEVKNQTEIEGVMYCNERSSKIKFFKEK